MKRTDWTVFAGIAIGAVALIAAGWLENLHISFLWNPSALLVVGGGTFGAVVVKRGLSGIGSVLQTVWNMAFKRSEDADHQETLARLAWLAKTVRKNGNRTYEGLANRVDDVLISNGFLLLADGTSKEKMIEALGSRLKREHGEGLRDVRTLEAAGGFAPTFGILGAVIALASVLRFVDDPAALGTGISSAFVATIYGIASANMLFFPIAARLRERHEAEMGRREEIANVLVSLCDQQTPRAIINQFNLMK